MSATLAVSPIPAHTIRIVAAPRSEPLTDDELHAAGLDLPAEAAQLLPLEMPAGSLVAEPDDDQATRPGGGSAGPAAVGEFGGPSPAQLAVRRLLATCVEVIGGFRPASQLRPFCAPGRFPVIAERVGGRAPAARSQTPIVGRSTGAPPRAGRARLTGPADRVFLRRVQVCEATEGVAEVAAVLARREQVWAMALRLELHDGRWLCTCVEVI